MFINNKAFIGGVVFSFLYNISDVGSIFHYNEANSNNTFTTLYISGYGAALTASRGYITLNQSSFVGNTANTLGTLALQLSNMKALGVMIRNNRVHDTHSSGVFLGASEVHFSDTTYLNNSGSLFATSSNVTFSGKSVFC